MIIQAGADPFPPYQFKTEQGFSGMDLELITAAFAFSGNQLELILKVWPKIEKDYDDGLVRILFQVQPTEERMRSNLFSEELRKAVTEIITSSEDEQPRSLEPFYTDLYLAVLEGYSYGDAIDAIPEDRKHRYPTQESLLGAVVDGTEAYGVFDRGVRLYLQKDLGIEGVTPLAGMDFLRPLAVMFSTGDTELRDTFDAGLKAIRNDGTYDAIIQRWEQI
jgi:polar amino acid transport system substrate-binding protein